jgi:hypothetical protein
MIENLFSLHSNKIYDRQLLLKTVMRDNRKFIESTLTDEQKREKLTIVFEVGKVSGRRKVITREEHEAFLTLASIGDARALVNLVIVNDISFRKKQDEARKWVNSPDTDFVYDYCVTLLRKKHWTTNEICSDFRIEK